MAGILTENNHQIPDTGSGSPGIVKKPQAKMTEPNGISKPPEVTTAPVANGDCLTTKVIIVVLLNYSEFIIIMHCL